MLGHLRITTGGSAFLVAAAIFWLLPEQAHAYGYPYPYPTPFPPPNNNMNNNNQANGGGGLMRATSQLANPMNFWQYGQVTGVAPIRGTVRIYNQFGTLAMAGLQGMNAGINGGGNQLPGQGTTADGDDPPQGVLLHVNYANMFLPNQQQLQNQQRSFGGFGGFGGFPGGYPGAFGGYPGGYGFGGFGGPGGFQNGGHGL
jgi:hypothetical protein